MHERGQRRGTSARQPVAERAVADLVVVLGEDDEPLGRRVVAGAPKRVAERRRSAVVDERARERLGELRHVAEVGVVALALAGEQRAQRVVEVVGPVRVAAPAARSAGA